MCEIIELDYFVDKVSMDEDLKRHLKEEDYLRKMIEYCKKSDFERDTIRLDTYYELLGLLLRSKAVLVDKMICT